MAALEQLQLHFQDYVLGDGDSAAIDHVLRGQPAIYRHAYRARLREALGEAYGKTWSYLGDELFDECVRDYIAQRPSSYRNLRWYGDAFAEHLARQLPEHPQVAELARFEWTLGLAFDAADAAPCAAAALAGLAPQDWAGLTFRLHPSVHLLALQWNAVAIWQQLRADAEPPDAARWTTPLHWLVWRHQEQPHFRSLDALEADALRRLGQGDSFGAVCAAVLSDDPQPACLARLAGGLRQWLEQGVLLISG